MPCSARAAIRTGAFGRDRADQRRDREPDHAELEDLAPAHPVTERAAEQQERGQRQRVGRDHPLQAGDAGVEVLADMRQRDADHGGIERGDARAEDRRGEHPASPGAVEGQLRVKRFSRRAHQASLTRCSACPPPRPSPIEADEPAACRSCAGARCAGCPARSPCWPRRVLRGRRIRHRGTGDPAVRPQFRGRPARLVGGDQRVRADAVRLRARGRADGQRARARGWSSASASPWSPAAARSPGWPRTTPS